jgi:hypothetical protein
VGVERPGGVGGVVVVGGGRLASKQATVIGEIGESDAPAMQTSTLPSSMEWKA